MEISKKPYGEYTVVTDVFVPTDRQMFFLCSEQNAETDAELINN